MIIAISEVRLRRGITAIMPDMNIFELHVFGSDVVVLVFLHHMFNLIRKVRLELSVYLSHSIYLLDEIFGDFGFQHEIFKSIICYMKIMYRQFQR